MIKKVLSAAAISVLTIAITGCCCSPTMISDYFSAKSQAEKALSEAEKRMSATTGAIVQPPAVMQESGATDLVKNGDFAPGLPAWVTRTQVGSKVEGTNSVEVVQAGNAYALKVSRTNGGEDGGGAYASQAINEDVSSYSSLVIKLAANVISEEGGNLANTNPQWFPEGACQIRIFYTDTTGAKAEKYHGFFSQTVSNADTEHFTQVSGGEWYSYTSPNLMDGSPKPKTIEKIEVYGFGWGFEGYMTNVQLLVK